MPPRCGVEFTDVEREDFRRLLQEIAETHMPFGKFGRLEVPPHGVPLMDLPPEYLAWFAERGFPQGRLGELMAEVWHIKAAGMDEVFEIFRQARGGRTPLRPRRPRSFRIRSAEAGDDS